MIFKRVTEKKSEKFSFSELFLLKISYKHVLRQNGVIYHPHRETALKRDSCACGRFFCYCIICSVKLSCQVMRILTRGLLRSMCLCRIRSVQSTSSLMTSFWVRQSSKHFDALSMSFCLLPKKTSISHLKGSEMCNPLPRHCRENARSYACSLDVLPSLAIVLPSRYRNVIILYELDLLGTSPRIVMLISPMLNVH